MNNRSEEKHQYYLINKERILKKAREYRENNRDKIREKSKILWDQNKDQYNKIKRQYYIDHKEEIQQKHREYRVNNKLKIQRKAKESYNSEKQKEYYSKNKSKIIKRQQLYISLKRKNDSNFRILCNLRRRIGLALFGNPKTETTMKLVGCNLEQLKKHLEEQFVEGMTWDNYGEWHIDHIVPCASFDLTDLEQQRICFHYTNLQPLWKLDNLRKGSKRF